MKAFRIKIMISMCLSVFLLWTAAVCPAFAQSDAKANAICAERESDGIKISGTVGGGASHAALVVLYPDKQLSLGYDQAADLTGIVCAAEMLPVEGGQYEYLCEVGPDGPFGFYTIRLRCGNEAYETKYRFTKGGGSYEDELKDALNGGADLMETLFAYNDLVLLDEQWFAEADEKLVAYFEELLSESIPIADANGFLAEVDHVVRLVKAMDQINSSAEGQLASVLKEHSDLLGFVFNPEDETAKSIVSKAFSQLPIYNVEKLTALNDSYILAKLNAASWGGYTQVIKTYDILDAEAELAGMSEGKQEIMFRYLADQSPFDSIAQFKSVFAEAKQYALSQKDDTGNTGTSPSKKGGGLGSKGSKGGSLVATIETAPGQLPAETSKQPFSDLGAAEWARESIEYLASANIVSGVGNGSFNPSGNVKREEFIKMALNALGYTVVSGKPPFEDIAADTWYENYVHTAFTLGIVAGVTDTEFGTGAAITRQDAAVILDRALKGRGIYLNITEMQAAPADMDEIADYAATAVKTMFGAKVLNGDENGAFLPKENLTRAQASKMLYEILMNQSQEETK